MDELPVVLPQEPCQRQQPDHEHGDHGEEPRRQIVLRLHRHLPVEHGLIARLPIGPMRPGGHRRPGRIVHLLGPGQSHKRRCQVGHLHQPRLPCRRGCEQSRRFARFDHHRRLHRRSLMRAVGDRGEHHGNATRAEAVRQIRTHPPGRFEDVPDLCIEFLQRVAIGGGISEIDEGELTVRGRSRHVRAEIGVDGRPVLDTTGGGGGGDRGTVAEGTDIGHRLGQRSEGCIVVVTAGYLRVHVPIGDPAVERRCWFAALIAGLVGGAPSGSEPQPAVDRAARRAHAARRDRPDLPALHHHPQIRCGARVEVLEAEPGDVDRYDPGFRRGGPTVIVSRGRGRLPGLGQAEDE